jgi:benzoate-CoA ligase family protein
MNLATILLERRLSAGDAKRDAFECGDRRWTYAETAALIDRTARMLRDSGVARGDRVMIVLPDSIEFVAAFLGTIKIGAVAVPCSTFLGPLEYRYFADESAARVVITTDDLHASVGLPAIRIATAFPEDAPVEAAQMSDEDPAFWLWTSGTTGRPKAAVHRHQDPPHCCRGIAEGVLGITSSDRLFSAAKLFHAYGLGNSLFFAFWTGASSVLFSGRSRPEAIFDVLQRTRPTVFFGVPTLFAAMLSADEAARLDLLSLRCCMSAAEPLAPELFERWKARFGSEILDGIGSTEMLHTYLSARRGCVKPGSVGTPVDGYEVKIVDERGEPVPAGEPGDLLVKGASRAASYWNRPDETMQRMQDGWFWTGDKFLVDSDGYYWYLGRSDDMFKVSGEWVSPSEIEGLLIEHPDVLECAVVPWRDDSDVVRTKACVVLRKGRTGSDQLIADLQQHVRMRTSHYKCPRIVEFLTELPKTATGKIQRYKLRRS